MNIDQHNDIIQNQDFNLIESIKKKINNEFINKIDDYKQSLIFSYEHFNSILKNNLKLSNVDLSDYLNYFNELILGIENKKEDKKEISEEHLIAFSNSNLISSIWKSFDLVNSSIDKKETKTYLSFNKDKLDIENEAQRFIETVEKFKKLIKQYQNYLKIPNDNLNKKIKKDLESLENFIVDNRNYSLITHELKINELIINTNDKTQSQNIKNFYRSYLDIFYLLKKQAIFYLINNLVFYRSEFVKNDNKFDLEKFNLNFTELIDKKTLELKADLTFSKLCFELFFNLKIEEIFILHPNIKLYDESSKEIINTLIKKLLNDSDNRITIFLLLSLKKEDFNLFFNSKFNKIINSITHNYYLNEKDLNSNLTKLMIKEFRKKIIEVLILFNKNKLVTDNNQIPKLISYFKNLEKLQEIFAIKTLADINIEIISEQKKLLNQFNDLFKIFDQIINYQANLNVINLKGRFKKVHKFPKIDNNKNNLNFSSLLTLNHRLLESEIETIYSDLNKIKYDICLDENQKNNYIKLKLNEWKDNNPDLANIINFISKVNLKFKNTTKNIFFNPSWENIEKVIKAQLFGKNSKSIVNKKSAFEKLVIYFLTKNQTNNNAEKENLEIIFRSFEQNFQTKPPFILNFYGIEIKFELHSELLIKIDYLTANKFNLFKIYEQNKEQILLTDYIKKFNVILKYVYDISNLNLISKLKVENLSKKYQNNPLYYFWMHLDWDLKNVNLNKNSFVNEEHFEKEIKAKIYDPVFLLNNFYFNFFKNIPIIKQPTEVFKIDKNNYFIDKIFKNFFYKTFNYSNFQQTKLQEFFTKIFKEKLIIFKNELNNQAYRLNNFSDYLENNLYEINNFKSIFLASDDKILNFLFNTKIDEESEQILQIILKYNFYFNLFDSKQNKLSVIKIDIKKIIPNYSSNENDFNFEQQQLISFETNLKNNKLDIKNLKSITGIEENSLYSLLKYLVKKINDNLLLLVNKYLKLMNSDLQLFTFLNSPNINLLQNNQQNNKEASQLADEKLLETFFTKWTKDSILITDELVLIFLQSKTIKLNFKKVNPDYFIQDSSQLINSSFFNLKLVTPIIRSVNLKTIEDNYLKKIAEISNRKNKNNNTNKADNLVKKYYKRINYLSNIKNLKDVKVNYTIKDKIYKKQIVIVQEIKNLIISKQNLLELLNYEYYKKYYYHEGSGKIKSINKNVLENNDQANKILNEVTMRWNKSNQIHQTKLFEEINKYLNNEESIFKLDVFNFDKILNNFFNKKELWSINDVKNQHRVFTQKAFLEVRDQKLDTIKNLKALIKESKIKKLNDDIKLKVLELKKIKDYDFNCNLRRNELKMIIANLRKDLNNIDNFNLIDERTNKLNKQISEIKSEIDNLKYFKNSVINNYELKINDLIDLLNEVSI